MTRLRHAATALGLLAPACAPSGPAPAHKGHQTSAPSPRVEDGADGGVAPASPSPAPDTTTTTEAPPDTTVYVVTVPTVPPTTTVVRPRPLPTTTLPEYIDEAIGDVEWAIRQTFPETPDKAVRVARCESGLDPHATNGQHVGVMQIATTVHAKRIAAMGYMPADLYGVTANLHVARAIYDDAGGWGPWTCAA